MQPNGLRIGSFAGAPIIIEPTIAFLALYWLATDFMDGGVAALGASLISLFAVIFALLIHELGHAATAVVCRVRADAIVLTFFGGYVHFVTPPQRRWQQMLISAAGPLANLATCALVALASPFVPPLPPGAAYFLQQLGFLSLLLGLFNLLPGYPLDGGAVLSAALSYMVRPVRALWIAAWSGVVIATGVGIWALTSGLWWTAAIGFIIGLNAFAQVARTQRILGADIPDPPA